MSRATRFSPGVRERAVRMVGGLARAWVIALDTMDAKRALHVEGAGAWKGGVFRAPASAGWKIRNGGQVAVQVMTAVAVRH